MKESYKKELLPNPPSTAYFFHSLARSEATLSRAQRDQAKRAQRVQRILSNRTISNSTASNTRSSRNILLPNPVNPKKSRIILVISPKLWYNTRIRSSWLLEIEVVLSYVISLYKGDILSPLTPQVRYTHFVRISKLCIISSLKVSQIILILENRYFRIKKDIRKIRKDKERKYIKERKRKEPKEKERIFKNNIKILI